MISCKTDALAIDEIDIEDHTYQITTESALGPLTRSIKDLGLITPPILRKKKSKYIIISGFKRIAACQKLQKVTLPARILPDHFSPLTCAEIAIAENRFHRTLNQVEISRALNLLDRFVDSPPVSGNILKLLGLPDNPSLTTKLKKLQGLPVILQNGLVAGRISMDMALRLGRWQDADGARLFKIFSVLGLSHSKQKELMTNLEEIALREDLPVTTLLASDEIQSILAAEDLDLHQKTKALRGCVKKRRYPHLYVAEKQFADALHHIKLGNRMSLKPADYFEGTSMTLHISFKNIEELHDDLASLDREINTPHFTNLIKSKYSPDL